MGGDSLSDAAVGLSSTLGLEKQEPILLADDVTYVVMREGLEVPFLAPKIS